MERNSRKRQRVSEEEVDDLPDSILVHILSFLPTKDAVRMVLVPIFRHLWNFLPTLSFDQSSCHDSWVHFGMRKEKVLDHDFSRCSLTEPDASYRLPTVVFGGKHLTDMKLTACEIKPSSQIQLNCLKQLSLKEIALKEEMINQILSGCCVLEEFSLSGCYGLRRLAFRNPSIKSLILNLSHQTQRLEISWPNAELLDIAGFIDLADLLDVSSVAVSSLFFSYGFKCSRKRYQTIKALFKKLSHSKMFTPCSWCILVFTIWQLINKPGLFFSWKCLQFPDLLTKWHHPGISCLLRTSPYLETLTMYISPGWHQIFALAESQWMKSNDFDGRKFWSSQEGTFNCLENHLKTIKIYGYITEPYVIDLIEFLLKKAMVLENLEISTQKTITPSHQAFMFSKDEKDDFSIEQKFEFSRKLLSLPRASTSAVIHFY